MSFGFSVGDLVAVSSLVFRVHDVLRQFDREGSTNSPEYYDLEEQVTELDSIYRAIERRGLGNLEEESDVIIRTSKDIQVFLTELEKFLWQRADPDGFKPQLSPWISLLLSPLLLWSPRTMKTIEKPMFQVFTARLKPVVLELQPLFLGVTPQTTLIGFYDTWPPPERSPESGPPTRNDPQIGAYGPLINSDSNVKIKVLLPRGCVLIISMFAVFVALSCFLGVFFTVKKEYGYSMGDSFTLAGYVVAVGALITAPVLVYHYPRCKCWDRTNDVHQDDIVMLSPLQLPEPD